MAEFSAHACGSHFGVSSVARNNRSRGSHTIVVRTLSAALSARWCNFVNFSSWLTSAKET